MARRSRTRLAPNPFVAFADVTIALSFIFAICSIALSKSLADMNRDERQTIVKDGIVAVLKDGSKAELKPNPINQRDNEYDKKRNIEIRLPDRTLLLRVWTNGSYQRIEVPGLFERGGLRLRPDSRRTLAQLAKVIQKAMVERQATYVYFHGITEPGEASGMSSREVSVRRAQAVYDFFVAQGAIARTKEEAKSDGKIDPRFAIDYGKAELYSRASAGVRGAAGRVDIIVFYGDRPEPDLNLK